MNICEAPKIKDEESDKKGSQALGSSTSDASFLANLGKDADKMRKIAKIEDSTERKKALQSFFDEILSEKEIGSGDSLARISALKLNNSLSEENWNEFDEAWSQEQVDDLTSHLFYLNRTGKISLKIIHSSIESILKKPSNESQKKGGNKIEDTIREKMIKSLIERIGDSHIRTNDDNDTIVVLSEELGKANMDSRLDLLVSVMNSTDKRFHEDKKNDVISNILSTRLDGTFFEEMEAYTESSQKDVYKILKAIDAIEHIENLMRSEVGHPKLNLKSQKILKNIIDNTSNVESGNYFIYTKSQIALERICGERYYPEGNDMTEQSSEKNDRFSRYKKESESLIEIYDLNESNQRFKSISRPLDSRKRDPRDIYVFLSRNNMGDNVILSEHTADGKIKDFIDVGEIIYVKELEHILEEEGFDRESMSKVEYRKALLNYRSLLDLPLRNEIESILNIELENFSIREQLQFVNFLSKNSFKELNRVGNFLDDAGGTKARKARMSSFLAMEFDPKIREIIFENLAFDQTIKQETKDKLFLAYANLSDEAKDLAMDLLEVSEDILGDGEMNMNLIHLAILRRTSELFQKAQAEFLGINVMAALERDEWKDNDKFGQNNAERLINFAIHKKELILNDLINDIKNENFELLKALEEFKDVNSQLSKLYENADLINYYKNSKVSYPDHYNQNSLADNGKKVSNDYGIDNYNYISSNEIKLRIEEMEQRLRNVSNESEESIESYKKLLQSYKDILELQTSMERKIERILYGQDTVSIPKSLFENIKQEASEIKPEKLPQKEPIYFPVGGSADLESLEKVLSGEMKMAKPIDIFGYLFWLNNQEKKSKLVVCSDMQRSNYKKRFPEKNDEEIDLAVKKISEREGEIYKKIISTFNLKNIKLVPYKEFHSEIADKFKKYKSFCIELASKENWREAFISMVQESVTDGQKRKDFLEYSIDELAWILAYDGLKIGHPNEARYDTLAAVIKNVERHAKEENIDLLSDNLSNQDQEKINFMIHGVIEGMNVKFNDSKSKKGPNKENYIKRVRRVLKLIRRPKLPHLETKKEKDEIVKKYKQVDFNFYCPEVTGRSFGWNKEKAIKDDSLEKTGFKEPYSTYFYSSKAEMFLNSNQVVADPEGNIGGKILTFSHEKQLEYIEKVLKPMIVNFIKNLDLAPQEYFSGVNSDKDQIIFEFKQASNITDTLRLVQKYIIKPCAEQD